LESGLLRQGKWTLLFYGFRREWASVDDLLPGIGDLFDRVRRNGAREGTPFFLDPSGRADWVVNAFWRSPGVRGLKLETQRRYAYSLKVWLDFLAAVKCRWDRVTRADLAMFKEWRLSAEDNPGSARRAANPSDEAGPNWRDADGRTRGTGSGSAPPACAGRSIVDATSRARLRDGHDAGAGLRSASRPVDLREGRDVVEVGQPDTKCLNRVSQLRPSFMQRDRSNSNPTL
jgi:hypothetical protein